MRRARSHVGILQDDKTLSSRICDVYQPAEGCPPLSGPWEGSPLSEDPWLKKFADCVAGEPLAAEAWRMLEQNIRTDGLRSLTELLYLFTVPKDTVVDKCRESYGVLNLSLESIIQAYDDLIYKLSDLMKSSGEIWLGYENLAEELRRLIAGRARADKVREDAVTCGSRKAKSRHCYLAFMASQMKGATGKKQLSALRPLITIAYAAHGEKSVPPEENSLGRNILRFRERYGIGHYLSDASTDGD
jgi:hypothetical protein